MSLHMSLLPTPSQVAFITSSPNPRKPCIAHSPPVFQPMPQHSPVSIPNSSHPTCSQQLKAPPATSPLPWNLSHHPFLVYLVNSSVTSSTMPSVPSIPSPEDLMTPLCYSYSTFGMHSFMYLSIDYRYLPCARNCPKHGNKWWTR